MRTIQRVNVLVRSGIIGLLVVLLGACSEQVTETENPECLTILGDPPDNPGLGDTVYQIILRSQESVSEVLDYYARKYPEAISAFELFGNGFNANVNQTEALQEMRCDSRIQEIHYLEIP